MYYRIKNGVAESAQRDINGFSGVWAAAEDGFDVGDLWDEDNGWSHPVKTTEELEAEAREWRNNELKDTDFIIPLSDYPNRDAWITYRQELRDWTDTSDFPATKPTKP
jgi:hypothetical protein